MAKDRINEMRNFLNLVDVPSIGGDPIGLREKPKENLHEGSDAMTVFEALSDVRGQLENLEYAINRGHYVDDGDSLNQKDKIVKSIKTILNEFKKLEVIAKKEKAVLWV